MNERESIKGKINGDTPVPTIFEEWERLAGRLIPVDAGRMQRLMMRAAYLAGLTTVLHLTDLIAEKLTEEDGANAIARLHEEADKFSADLMVDGIEFALSRAGARF
ncbi:hypothetical protein [Paraburkholderia caribensis]|uniref:hypothetical protein n=1 Tax=Paraburkholderia caribensis TaxID=75105 RepID=UPI0028635C1A|nr:hypothetical protein [Paraburkholderia caribensis]MDR6384961.1 hypothetical protein [Paraburkholderia caribensis]